MGAGDVLKDVFIPGHRRQSQIKERDEREQKLKHEFEVLRELGKFAAAEDFDLATEVLNFSDLPPGSKQSLSIDLANRKGLMLQDRANEKVREAFGTLSEESTPEQIDAVFEQVLTFPDLEENQRQMLGQRLAQRRGAAEFAEFAPQLSQALNLSVEDLSGMAELPEKMQLIKAMSAGGQNIVINDAVDAAGKPVAAVFSRNPMTGASTPITNIRREPRASGRRTQRVFDSSGNLISESIIEDFVTAGVKAGGRTLGSEAAKEIIDVEQRTNAAQNFAIQVGQALDVFQEGDLPSGLTGTAGASLESTLSQMQNVTKAFIGESRFSRMFGQMETELSTLEEIASMDAQRRALVIGGIVSLGAFEFGGKDELSREDIRLIRTNIAPIFLGGSRVQQRAAAKQVIKSIEARLNASRDRLGLSPVEINLLGLEEPTREEISPEGRSILNELKE